MKKILLFLLLTILFTPNSVECSQRWQLVKNNERLMVYVDLYTMDMQHTELENTLTVWHKYVPKDPEVLKKWDCLEYRTSYKFSKDNTDTYSKKLAAFLYKDDLLITSKEKTESWKLISPDSNEERIYTKTLLCWTKQAAMSKAS